MHPVIYVTRLPCLYLSLSRQDGSMRWGRPYTQLGIDKLLHRRTYSDRRASGRRGEGSLRIGVALDIRGATSVTVSRGQGERSGGCNQSLPHPQSGTGDGHMNERPVDLPDYGKPPVDELALS